jgi:hypothetical protein
VLELEIRLPHSARGDGDEWEDVHEVLMNDLEEALSESGAGDQDDPDHGNEYISYFLAGDDIEAVKQVARQVLERAGLLDTATAFFVSSANDTVTHEPVALR